MKYAFRILFLFSLMVCLFQCGHLPTPFHYVKQSPYAVAPLKTIDVWIDKDFSDNDQIFIDDAVNQWNFALNGRIHINIVSRQFNMEESIIRKVFDGGGWLFMKVTSDNPMVQDVPNKDGSPGSVVVAWADKVGGNRIYMVRDRLPDKWMTGVMLHEIGHLLGAKHQVTYLMEPTYKYEDSRCIDEDTLKQVAIVQDIPFNRLNYCVYGLNENRSPALSDGINMKCGNRLE
jgi:hypothetical protein